MRVFTNDNRPFVVWGPTASVKVSVPGLSDLIDDSWFLDGVQIGAREIVDVRQCFGDIAYIYALGNDQEKCRITLIFKVCIGNKWCEGSSAMEALDGGLAGYAEARISNHTSPEPITIGSFTRNGWVVGFDAGNLDAEKGTCEASVACLMEL